MNTQKTDYYVYIIASGLNGFLYTGMTENLHKEVSEHKCLIEPQYTGWRLTHKLVYIEGPASIDQALKRKLELQKMKRDAQVSLIEGANRDWQDLFYDYNTFLDMK